jgi:hypothetical protein
MYVHILLLHAAGLLTILHTKAMLCVFIVFVLVFAHLGWQNTGRRADTIKDYKGKAVLYYFAAVVNAITLGVLLQYQQPAAHNTFMGADTWFVVVVLLSLALYVADNYI